MFVANKELDIIALGLALSFFSVVLFISTVALINFSHIKNRLTLDSFVHSEKLFSKQPNQAVLTFKGWHPSSFFNLTCNLSFLDSTFKSQSYELLSTNDKRLSCNLELTFPHRGHWRVKEVTLFYEDRFGLIRLKEKKTPQISLLVHPQPVVQNESLPIITSSFREGDSLYSQTEQFGDPFDLKPYNPADGVKKIVWKVYARSGELISRHSETAFSPEGEVLVFLGLRRLDDKACAVALAYIDEILNQALEFKAFHTADYFSTYNVFNNKAALVESILETVWRLPEVRQTKRAAQAKQKDTGSVSLELLSRTVAELNNESKRQYKKIVVFCDKGLSKEVVAAIENTFITAKIEPVVFGV